MPLIKKRTKEAFNSNVSAERKAGKPLNQALAIAYRIQRESKASGGKVMPYAGKSGFIHGATAGRSDKVPAKVKVKSYIIPADIVSSLGEGNSIAGAQSLNKLFKLGPYGSGKQGFAAGGEAPDAEIIVSDGEYTVPPEKIEELGGGDIDRGHEVLDAFVKHIRRKTIKTLQKLPGPKNS